MSSVGKFYHHTSYNILQKCEIIPLGHRLIVLYSSMVTVNVIIYIYLYVMMINVYYFQLLLILTKINFLKTYQFL